MVENQKIENRKSNVMLGSFQTSAPIETQSRSAEQMGKWALEALSRLGRTRVHGSAVTRLTSHEVGRDRVTGISGRLTNDRLVCIKIIECLEMPQLSRLLYYYIII